MTNFWQTINKPILALAPMEDVTDTVFREVIRSVSEVDALHVLFTEFTSTDGLCNEFGRAKVSDRLVVGATESALNHATNTKLVAQIWGSNPTKFYESAKLISQMGHFDGIDINMGCPVKKVVKNKCCSALINYPELAKEIIIATKEATQLPVSVKTRIGFNEIVTEKWVGQLLEVNPAALTIHGRTQKMMSTGLALWDEIAKVVRLRNERESSTVILGNGDVSSYADAQERIIKYGVDGVMVGTGIFKNPWLFNTLEQEITQEMRFNLLKKHIALYDKTWDNKKNFNILKRYFKIYITGFEGAAEWRDKLMHTKGCMEALYLLK